MHFDVIVAGVGSMGSAACFYLAQRGAKVLGLEQFQIVHERGSHTGQSRITRQAYYEHPDYVPLLLRAYDNLRNLEEVSGKKLYYKTGLLYGGPSDSEVISGVMKAAQIHRLLVEKLSANEVRTRYSAFNFPEDFKSLYEAEAGFILPEETIRTYTQLAIRAGADIHTGEIVVSWKKEGSGVTVVTDRRTYHASRIVFTTGSWTSKLIAKVLPALKVTRQSLGWIYPERQPENFNLGSFPCWFIDDPGMGPFYGFPLLPEDLPGPRGMKLALHVPGRVVDPDLSDGADDNSETVLRYAIQRYLPTAFGEFSSFKTCLYTNSPDGHFIIDFVPEADERAIVACGFSGHGFKFVPVVGEILAEMAIAGRSSHPVDFLSLGRFDKRAKTTQSI